MARWPRRLRMTPSMMTLNRAETLVASAGPMCRSGTMKARFSARFSAMAAKPTRDGGGVSPWAKKAGTKTFRTTNAGRPKA